MHLANNLDSSEAGGCLGQIGLQVELILASPPWRRPFKLDPFTFFSSAPILMKPVLE